MDNSNTWGGKREGSGRPSTGRKRYGFWLTEEERDNVKQFIQNMRGAKKMEQATGINIYTEDGHIWFEDDNDRVELTESINASDVYYDEREGYILADGRNLSEIYK